MRIPRVFLDQELQVGGVFELDSFASGHICRVLRMKTGRPLILFNGRGGEYKAEIHTADPKRAKVEIISFDAVARESNLRIHLGLALSRGDRFDWAIQKAVELGVASVTPLNTVRSDSIGDAKRQERKIDQWRKLIISACEQSGRTSVPNIFAPMPAKDWMAKNAARPSLLLHPTSPSITSQISDLCRPLSELNLAVGPEGGFDENEIIEFQQLGFLPVSFGPRVLRTETAPVAVISVLQYLLGDLAE